MNNRCACILYMRTERTFFFVKSECGFSRLCMWGVVGGYIDSVMIPLGRFP